MQVISNFVKPRIQDELEKLFLGDSFPYFYNSASVYEPSGNSLVDVNTVEAPQFSHLFVSEGAVNSNTYNNIAPIINKLIDTIDGDYYVYRCKVNLNTIDTRFDGKYHTPHIDNPFDDQITAVYYVNNADGDTFFFGDDGKVAKQVTPKKGTLILWHGKILHAKASPTKALSRVVININLLPIVN